MRRAYKYRFYPTDAQAALLSRTFGCVRYVYNKALEERTRAWYQDGRRSTFASDCRTLTELKRTEEAAFLGEVSNVALQQALQALQDAFVNFWAKRTRYPKFKSRKKSRRSATFTTMAFRYRDGQIFLAKCAEPLNIIWSRPLPEEAQPSRVTVSQDAAGRWFISILVEDATVKPLPPSTGAVGIDAGLDCLVALSTGEKVTNPRHANADRKRLALAQRSLSRKEKGSNNRAKAQVKVAKVHAKITDRRRDFLHKLSTRLVHENQVIVIEDLAVRNMLRNHSLARAISDAAWSELRSMLEYKCTWYGRDLVVIDRWYPSSKTCSGCGHLVTHMPLNIRTWTCERCGAFHDRDVNAAKNILAAGLAVSACGEGVRPSRARSGRQSLLKQETRRESVGIPRL